MVNVVDAADADFGSLTLMDTLANKLWHSKNPLHSHGLKIILHAQELPDLLEALLDVIDMVFVQKVFDVDLGHLFSVLVAVVAHQVKHFSEVGIRLVKAVAFLGFKDLL